jgi:hypothetical protein
MAVKADILLCHLLVLGHLTPYDGAEVSLPIVVWLTP